jgi:single-stranded-DNA-specific exonuclease
MDLAVKRIEAALENEEKVLIYGDYDVDGTTAVALQYLFFRNRFKQIDFYVPDRYTEGYGISKLGIDYAA